MKDRDLTQRSRPSPRSAVGRVLLKLGYWLAVLCVSVVLVVLLVRYFESQDQGGLGAPAPTNTASNR